MWKVFLMVPSAHELADFALLSVSVNQAGLERNFSDLKIKKRDSGNAWSCQGLRRWRRWAFGTGTHRTIDSRVYVDFQVGADIRSLQKESGLVEERKKWNWMRMAGRVRAEATISIGEVSWGMAKGRVQEEHGRSEDEELLNIAYDRQRSKWLPRSLELLFAGSWMEGIGRRWTAAANWSTAGLLRKHSWWSCWQTRPEEADEERIPDDGELESSGRVMWGGIS